MKTITLRLFNYYKRQMATLFHKNSSELSNNRPIVTFTFDDFPKSAYSLGGKILNAFNFKATYYVSLKLMGSTLPSGEAYTIEDIQNLLKDGHELGCHTYDHFESWKTGKIEFRTSIEKNSQVLYTLVPEINFKNFSYPKSNPSPINKAIAGKYFNSSRGGGQDINTTNIDLNLLKSYFIDQKNNTNFYELQNLVEKNIVENGWLIISTHDISDTPSAFGCSIDYFKEIVTYVSQKNLCVLTISETLRRYSN